MSKIALFGATGTLGSRILDEALRRGHSVTAVVRDPAKIDRDDAGLTVVTGDVLDPESVAAHAGGQSAVVSAVGGGDGPGHIATIKPSAESLVAGIRTLGAGAPRLILVGGAGDTMTTNNLAGTTLWVNGSSAFGDAVLYLGGSLSNLGTILLESSNGG